eukprot:5055428-Prymnesium_polylepis.1
MPERPARGRCGWVGGSVPHDSWPTRDNSAPTGVSLRRRRRVQAISACVQAISDPFKVQSTTTSSTTVCPTSSTTLVASRAALHLQVDGTSRRPEFIPRRFNDAG